MPLADMPTRTAVGMPPEKGPFDACNNGRAPPLGMDRLSPARPSLQSARA